MNRQPLATRRSLARRVLDVILGRRRSRLAEVQRARARARDNREFERLDAKLDRLIASTSGAEKIMFLNLQFRHRSTQTIKRNL